MLHQSGVRIEVRLDTARLRPHDVPIVQGDASRIRAELGWTPAIPVEQTLADTLDWWRAREHAARSGNAPRTSPALFSEPLSPAVRHGSTRHGFTLTDGSRS